MMTRIFKTKNFVHWARKENISDNQLCRAVDEIKEGLIDAELGNNLIKKRIAKPGQGKRGGYRTLIAFRNLDENTFFMFGFSKNERDSININEKEIYRKLAGFYLNLDVVHLDQLIELKKIFEVNYGEYKT